jgi:hypothetical protein
MTSGLLVYDHRKAAGELRIPKAPGYILPPTVFFTVPGKGSSPSIESMIQEKVFALAGTEPIGHWIQEQVFSLLNEAAVDAAAYLDGQDPAAESIPTLVARYAAIYRVAVTPV